LPPPPALAISESAPTPSPGPLASAVASAPRHVPQSSVRRPKASEPAPKATSATGMLGCDPPYTVDPDGIRHYKKECE
jgi:hypothetical protein